MRALYNDLERAVSTTLTDAAGPYNFGLRFNKWVSFRLQGSDWEFDKSQYKSIADDFGRWAKRQQAGLQQSLDRLDAYARTAEQRKELAIQFEAAVTSPLVIGIGGAHPSETGLIFHWTLGVPSIPSSSVKGLCRFAFEVAELNQFESLDAMKAVSRPFILPHSGKQAKHSDGSPRNEPFIHPKNTDSMNPLWPPTVAHFGSQDAMGAVRFLDALPLPGVKLALDIMNPHYPDYYGQKKGEGGEPIGPTESQNPNPILFWTVASGAQFRFVLVAAEKHSDHLDRVRDCLEGGLREYGIGAKTAVGYGRMKVTKVQEHGGEYDRRREAQARQQEEMEIRAQEERRAADLQRAVESAVAQLRTFKGPQDKSRLVMILATVDRQGLTGEERQRIGEQLEQVLAKDFRKGPLGKTLQEWVTPKGI